MSAQLRLPTSPDRMKTILAEKPMPIAAQSVALTALKGTILSNSTVIIFNFFYYENRYVSNSGCDECRCYEPCRGYSCPDGTQCQPELVRDETDPNQSATRVQPACSQGDLNLKV